MSRQKQQGTAEETWNRLFYSLVGTTRRLAEGGAYDEGDVEIVNAAGRTIIESKACANLNPHRTLAKAIAKAGGIMRVAVAHKRLVSNGGARRVPDGVIRTVTITPEYYRHLLQCEVALAEQGRDLSEDVPS